MGEKTFTLALPTPPSVNTMFRNAGANDNVKHRIKSAAYLRWKTNAMKELMIQRPPKIKGQVGLDFRHGKLPKNADVSNYIKAAEDLLVTMGIIEGDKREIVLWVSSAYDPTLEGSAVRITALET